MRFLKTTLLGAATALLAGAASAETVAKAENEEWITVTGAVGEVMAEGFSLDLGENDIKVEVDGAIAEDAGRLQAGDRVTVMGRVDDDLWQSRTIEASSIYVPRLQELLTASSRDEEGAPWAFVLVDMPDEGDWVGVTGRVTMVDEAQNEIRVDMGTAEIQVDTTALGYTTLAESGDHVSVYGRLDSADLIDKREIDAQSIVIIPEPIRSAQR